MDITLQKMADELKKSPAHRIYFHKKPDGDAIGAAYALAHGLKSLGSQCELLCCDPVSDKYRYITDSFSNEPQDGSVGIVVDSQGPDRLGKYGEESLCFCLDHHENNRFDVEFRYVDKTKASCCEIIYDLLNLMHVKITVEIANALYTGIITDTSCFRTRNTNASALRAATALAEQGADIVCIARKHFLEKSRQRMEIEKILCSSFRYTNGEKVLTSMFTYEDMQGAGIDDSKLEGLNEVVDQVAGIDIGILIREIKPSVCRVSVRTSEKYNANTICAGFGGGGHTDRAGCEIRKPPSEVRKLLEEACAQVVLE